MFYKRATSVFLIIIICFGVLIARLFSLSIQQGEAISITAQKQQQYLFTLAEKRGTIYDRNLNPMTYLGSSCTILVQPSLLENRDTIAKYLAFRAKWSVEEMNAKLQIDRPFSFDTAYPLEEQLGITVLKTYNRSADKEARHVLGTANEEENIGLSGIEAVCDEILAKKAEIYVSAAVDGKRREILGAGVSIFSENYYTENGVQLTLDKEIQHFVEQGASEYLEKGAVIVSDITTWEIVALCSKPTYDPQYMDRYLNSENGELLNRAMQCYNLGSVFKIVVAATAYETDTVLTDKVYCNGSVTIDGRTFLCHKAAGHGSVDMEEAFKQSCNPYFIKQGIATGLNPILEMAQRFGLYEPITLWEGYTTRNTVMPNFYKGTNPSTALIANTAIGQGDILISPLHAISIVNTVANGGIYQPLSIISGTVEQGKVTSVERKEEKRIISEETAAYVKNLMHLTMESGTGTSAHPDLVSGGGKTGSAETGQKIEGEDVTQAWFAGYFPDDHPKYSIVVFAENGKSGAAACSPLFKYISNEMVKNGFLD